MPHASCLVTARIVLPAIYLHVIYEEYVIFANTVAVTLEERARRACVLVCAACEQFTPIDAVAKLTVQHAHTQTLKQTWALEK